MSCERWPAYRRAQRGVSLIEALVALVLLTLTMLAVLRIQAVWSLAEDDARMQRAAARWLQGTVDRWMGGSEPAVAATASGPPEPLQPRLTLQHHGLLPATAFEATLRWVLVQHLRGGAVSAWVVQGHRFQVSPAVYSGWSAESGAHEPGWWAPGQRAAAMDPGFGLTAAQPGVPSPGLPSGSVSRFAEIGTSVLSGRHRRSTASVCTGVDLDAVLSGRPPSASCDATRHATRAGAIRWAPVIAGLPALVAARANWLTAVLPEPSQRARGSAAGDPRCGYGLTAPGATDLTWRCLGSVWSPPVEAPGAVAPARPGQPGWLSEPMAPPADFAFDGRPIHPLAGLPTGFRACRFTTGGPADDRAGAAFPAEALSIVQHQRVHWWVGPASHDCPEGTVSEPAPGPGP
jgi:hypothetical protein